jgi:FdhE protein
MPSTILEPGQLEPAAGSFPTLRLPARGLFAARRDRLRVLASGHALGPFLLFAAQLAECQEGLWETLEPDPLPSADLLARCRESAMPPLTAPGWWPGEAWHELARRLAVELKAHAPDPMALDRLAQAPDDWLETQAHALLDADGAGLDLATAPLIGAALQVCWAAAAARLDPAAIAPPGLVGPHPGLCPVCGPPPVASVLRIGGAQEGLRYLHCGLCASEWHVVRAKCSLCDNSRGIAYLSLACSDTGHADPDAERAKGPQPAIQAEACPECRGYLKLCRLERDPQADPWADDLATLALDLLMDREGFERAGLNFLLLQSGSTEPLDA